MVGKILGESLVALPQALAIMVVALLIGVPISPLVAIALLPIVFAMAMFGGAFGLLIMSNIQSQRAAGQIFPFVMLPQYFLAGVFNPIHGLPGALAVASYLSPMRYAVELVRNVFYGLQPGLTAPAVSPASTNLAVVVGMFVVFVSAGTTLFSGHGVFSGDGYTSR